MDLVYFCANCGDEIKVCSCEEVEFVEYENPDFVFEYAHEFSCSPYSTVFKKVPPEYD